MSNSPTIETLTCANCGSDFDRERKRGVKPKHCPDCVQALADEAKAAERDEQKIQTLHCEVCDQDWTRPAQRGAPPRRCPNCGPTRFVSAPRETIAKAAEQIDGMLNAISGSGNDHYSVDRLTTTYEQVPTEEAYKFIYIQNELAHPGIAADREKALKRVWATLEGGLR